MLWSLDFHDQMRSAENSFSDKILSSRTKSAQPAKNYDHEKVHAILVIQPHRVDVRMQANHADNLPHQHKLGQTVPPLD